MLERHPNLNVVIEEVGIDWLPHLLTAMEPSIGRTGPDLRDDEFRPSHLVVRRHLHAAAGADGVRAPPGARHAAAGLEPDPGVIEHVPPEVLCFSSDYPHVEGSASAVELCERQLDSARCRRDEARSAFFGGVGELLGV